MKTDFLKRNTGRITALILLVLLSRGMVFCQDNRNTGQKSQEKTQAITPEQTATIKMILSKYNAATLTAADAKAIHEKFREAGIHAGPETQDAIKAAGFDPDKLRTLDPPPNSNNPGQPKPMNAEERLKTVQTSIIKPLKLNSSQEETVTKAFRDFFTETEALAKTQANPQAPIEKSKIEPLEKKRDEKIRLVLTAAQFQQYQELEKASRPARPNESQNKPK